MEPKQIAKKSEHSHQAAYFCWLAKQTECPQLMYAFAVPNGGLRNKVQAAKLKAEGVKPGVPDVFLPYPCGQYAGLWLEFKKPGFENRKNGGLSTDQIRWRQYLESCHYEYKVVYSWLQAVDCTIEYLKP